MCSSSVMLLVFSLDSFVDVKTFDLFLCLPTIIDNKTLALRDSVEAIPPGGGSKGDSLEPDIIQERLRPFAFSSGKRRLRTRMCARA